MKPIFDPLHCERGELVVPMTCPCCTKCWLFVQGKRTGRCICGGPFKGYVEIPDIKARAA